MPSSPVYEIPCHSVLVPAFPQKSDKDFTCSVSWDRIRVFHRFSNPNLWQSAVRCQIQKAFTRLLTVKSDSRNTMFYSGNGRFHFVISDMKAAIHQQDCLIVCPDLGGHSLHPDNWSVSTNTSCLCSSAKHSTAPDNSVKSRSAKAAITLPQPALAGQVALYCFVEMSKKITFWPVYF